MTTQVEVSITNPAQDQHAWRAGQEPLYAATHMEERKIKKYSLLAAQAGEHLTTFVMESTGALGTQAQKLVKMADTERAGNSTGFAATAPSRTWATRTFSQHFLHRLVAAFWEATSQFQTARLDKLCELSLSASYAKALDHAEVLLPVAPTPRVDLTSGPGYIIPVLPPAPVHTQRDPHAPSVRDQQAARQPPPSCGPSAPGEGVVEGQA